ncbi:MAG: glycosyltransferase [Bacteroidetes bacterium]|nr:glycosyltransferase [Bacteroidota bacterium]
MITYNHEKYIADAIEGVLFQKTNFKIELVIGEDGSSDRTKEIIREYHNKYPNIIKPRYNNLNIGMMSNAIKTFGECQGKYIALCEGDDYWTDPYKLQKQVDFMEANENYSYCCTKFSILNDNTKIISEDERFSIYSDGYVNDAEITKENLFDPYISHTLTVVYRNHLLTNQDLKQPYFKDIFLYMCLLQKGNGKFLNFNSSVYRLNDNSIWGTKPKSVQAKQNFLTAESMFNYFPLENNKHLVKFYIGCLFEYCHYLPVHEKHAYLGKKYTFLYYYSKLKRGVKSIIPSTCILKIQNNMKYYLMK